jgi:SAM-dependent methyltransferase
LTNTDPEVVGATLASTLDMLDDAVNYLDWIVDLARPYLDGRILEVGSGHGTFTSELAEIGQVHAIEPSAHACGLLRDRYGTDVRVAITEGTVDQLATGATYGSAIMINVLEHIEDHQGALRQIYARLRPGGHVVVWVPAYNFLYSDFDRKLGHYRRYRRRGLEQTVMDAGFLVVTSRYVNLPGWFSWLVLTRLLRLEPTAGPMVRIFDRFVVPVVRAVESRITPPFGQSVLIAARKPFGME